MNNPRNHVINNSAHNTWQLLGLASEARMTASRLLFFDVVWLSWSIAECCWRGGAVAAHDAVRPGSEDVAPIGAEDQGQGLRRRRRRTNTSGGEGGSGRNAGPMMAVALCGADRSSSRGASEGAYLVLFVRWCGGQGLARPQVPHAQAAVVRHRGQHVRRGRVPCHAER